MRTTVTLDPDVERLLREAMREKSISFKEALNEAARAGLRKPGQGKAKRFVQTTFRMGCAGDYRWDKAMAIADALEDEELVRKLEILK
ncbi:MAG: antitoxin [Acidobacteria bacterium]|nr:antitoxin [Acidobacteriota bacterium]